MLPESKKQRMTIRVKDQQKILRSVDVYKVMQGILLREQKIDREKKHFWMIGLAANNRIQYIEMMSLDNVKASTLEPINVFRIAVMKGSVSIIIVQNRPSGEMVPSEYDKDLTERLVQVGRILNIAVIDHLIISIKSFISFADINLMEELERRAQWVSQYEIVEHISKEESREEAVKSAKVRGIKSGKKEMAKVLLQKGVDIAIIMESSGLTKEEIERLK